MKGLTQATVRDSAAMKQIAYLTMVFLPASFAAVCLNLLYTCLMSATNDFTQGVFGMNIRPINPMGLGTIRNYFAATVSLTLVTIWVVVAFQGKWSEREGEEASIWKRLGWPIVFMRRMRNKTLTGEQSYNGAHPYDVQ